MLGANEAEDMRANLRADIEHIERRWTGEADLHTLRREASMLRRLLVDNGGDIPRLWRADQRPGQPMIDGVVDLAAIVQSGRVTLAVAEMVTVDDGSARHLTSFADVVTDQGPQTSMGFDETGQRMNVRDYLRSLCLVWRDVPVRRDDLITYVVNKRGGAHSDGRRSSGSPARIAAHLALDELRAQQAQVDGREPAFASFIAIGRRLVVSEDIRSLCDPPSLPQAGMA